MAGNEPPEEVSHLFLLFTSCLDEEVDEEVSNLFLVFTSCLDLRHPIVLVIHLELLAPSRALYVMIDYKQLTQQSN